MAYNVWGDWKPENAWMGGECLDGHAQPDSRMENVPSELGTIRPKARFNWQTGDMEPVDGGYDFTEEMAAAMAGPVYGTAREFLVSIAALVDYEALEEARRSVAYPQAPPPTLGETALGGSVEPYETPPDDDGTHFGSVTGMW